MGRRKSKMKKSAFERKFGGKTFQLRGTYGYKVDAKAAKSHRKALGQKVRILKRGKQYEVWARG